MNWSAGVDGASLAVQIGFGSGPNDALAGIAWTDVTTKVRTLSFSSGKSDELDSYQAGMLSVVLDNRDRRFDPLYTAGPYFGNLNPLVPIRVRMTYSATTVTLWTGFISGWPQAFNPPRDATVTISASDGFIVLQQAILPTVSAYETALDSPILWWRLNETSGSVAFDSSPSHYDGTYTSDDASLTFAFDDFDQGDGGQSFSGGGGAFVGMAWPAFPFSFDFFIKPDNSAATLETLLSVRTSANATLKCAYDGTTFYVDYIDDAATFDLHAEIAPFQLLVGTEPTHVGVTFANGTSAPILYINGAVDGTTSASGTAPNLGAVNVEWISSDTSTMVLYEFAVYPSVLSAARMAAHWFALISSLAGYDTGSAVSKVLDMAGWPSADRSIETGITIVSPVDTRNHAALDTIKLLETSEQGRFYIGPDGVATYRNRHHTLSTAASTTSQATFGDGAGELPYIALRLDQSAEKIRNVVHVTPPFQVNIFRTPRGTITVSDATSVAQYGTRTVSFDGLLQADIGEARAMCEWILSHYSQPLVRVPEIELTARRSPTTLFPQVRDRRLLDRVTITRRPQGVGTAISFSVLIEGSKHEITTEPMAWKTTFLLSPAEVGAYLILDDPVFGKIDANKLAF